MRVHRSNEHRMKRTRNFDIADIPALAGQETDILHPAKRRAYRVRGII
jgi:hypothetical protein